MPKERLIRKIEENRSNGQKYITIPKKSNLHGGDYVELIKVPEVKHERIRK